MLQADYEFPRKPSKGTAQAVRLASYLTLQGTVRLAGAVDFFHDLQSLAFQASIHFVLPSLKSKHPAEHALLLHALLLFPLEYATDDPAHYSYLLSMIHGYLGNETQKLRCLVASFRSTTPEDHSYLTKAQEVWSEMLDEGQFKEAENFLFSLHWSSRPWQQEEVRQMVMDGLKFILSAERVPEKAPEMN